DHCLLCEPRIALRKRVPSRGQRGSGEYRTVGQERNGILGILPQTFERCKQEGFVFLDGEADGAAVLLAAERIPNRIACRSGVEISKGWVRRQSRTVGEGTSG